jgi:Bacteriophage holin.
MKLNKLILVPVISSILVFIKESMGYELPDGTADIIATGILWLVGFLGITMHPKSTKFDDSENFE